MTRWARWKSFKTFQQNHEAIHVISDICCWLRSPLAVFQPSTVLALKIPRYSLQLPFHIGFISPREMSQMAIQWTDWCRYDNLLGLPLSSIQCAHLMIPHARGLTLEIFGTCFNHEFGSNHITEYLANHMQSRTKMVTIESSSRAP